MTILLCQPDETSYCYDMVLRFLQARTDILILGKKEERKGIDCVRGFIAICRRKDIIIIQSRGSWSNVITAGGSCLSVGY